jgi:hypothetical protein
MTTATTSLPPITSEIAKIKLTRMLKELKLKPKLMKRLPELDQLLHTLVLVTVMLQVKLHLKVSGVHTTLNNAIETLLSTTLPTGEICHQPSQSLHQCHFHFHTIILLTTELQLMLEKCMREEHPQ